MNTQEFTLAWNTVKQMIDTGKPFPAHFGAVDITEHIPFADISDTYGLSESQYERLIKKAEKYYEEVL